MIAAEVGHLELAHDYLGEAALMDLKDLEHNVRDGVHIGNDVTVGAGAAVVRNVADGSVVVGVPAAPLDRRVP